MTGIPRAATRPATRQPRRFLPEIQALRMWAVGLVVVFHLWPDGPLRGGFVGVDAFFVISGFLITSHLLREATTTGTINLPRFYARRARRLLPASLLVLLASTALSWVYLAPSQWRPVASEILASTFYVQNLWLAHAAVTYSASTEQASPVQHYWSLSTEEQFYLVWPALVLLGLWAARRRARAPLADATRADGSPALGRGARHRRRPRPVLAVAVVLALVGVASLVTSIVWTSTDQASAYFVTPTRAWEFCVGAMLGLVADRLHLRPRVAVAARYVGLGALLGSAHWLSQASPFPSAVAAVPVLGTAAVIAAGDCDGTDPLDALFTNRVAQWLGNISYSIYLWHWPLIACAPFVVGGPVRLRHKLVIIAVTLVLAHLTRRYVEDATRYVPRVRTSTRWTGIATAITMAVAAGGAGTLTVASVVQDRLDAQALRTSAHDPCFGARGGLSGGRCGNPFAAHPLVQVGGQDDPWKTVDGCTTDHDPYIECSWGRTNRTVALIGDSHAEQYRAPLHAIAKARGWRLLVMIRPSCPPVDGVVPTFLGSPRKSPDACRRWARSSTDIMRREHVSLVLTSAYSASSPVSGDPTGAYRRMWDTWATLGPVVVIRDSPGTHERDMPACLAQHAGRERECALRRSEALPDDQAVVAARGQKNPRVRFLDLSDAYCDTTTCYAVAGRMPVYRDRNHVAYRFAETLRAALEKALPTS